MHSSIKKIHFKSMLSYLFDSLNSLKFSGVGIRAAKKKKKLKTENKWL